MRIMPFVAMSALCLVAPATLGGGSANELKLLAGKWIPVTAEFAGQPFADNVLKTIKLTITGDKYTVLAGETVDKGKLECNGAKKPKTMDIIGLDGPNKGKSFPAIYEVEKGLLRICYDLSGTSRPKEFKTKEGTRHFLVLYKRTK